MARLSPSRRCVALAAMLLAPLAGAAVADERTTPFAAAEAVAAPAVGVDAPDSQETLQEQELALAAELAPQPVQPPLVPGSGPQGVTSPLFVGVDDLVTSAFLIDVTNSNATPAFTGFAVWGAAYDAVNNRVLFNSGSTLREWPVGGAVNTLGTIVDGGGAAQSMVSLAWHNGVLYGTKNIANEAVWVIDPTTLVATVLIDYVDGDYDFGGLAVDPATGDLYATNDDATPHGNGLFRINNDATATQITPYPDAQTDIDGLSIGGGFAYLVIDQPGWIYVWDLAGGAFAPPLTAPWTTSETFSAGAWIGTGGPTTPNIQVNPADLTSTLPPGGQETLPLDIQNTGDGTLTWDIEESTTPLRQIVLGGEAPTGAVPLILDDGVAENAIGLTAGGQFIWLNRFTPSPADFPFDLTEISVLFRSGDGINVGELVDLYVYEDADGNPANGATHVGSLTGQAVQALDAFSVYPLPALTLNGPGDVLIAVVNRTAGTGAGEFPAAIDQTASQVRSWVGIYAGNPADPPVLPAPTFGTIDSFGFAGNWLVRGLGTHQAGGCATPTDVPWLSVSPVSGSTPAGGTSTVDVTIDATGLAPGLYQGFLCVNSNDPDTPLVQVPVDLTVTDTMPFLDGFETGDTSRWSFTTP